MSEPKCVFVSFGGPSPNYHRRVQSICQQIQSIMPTINVMAFTDEHLKKDAKFWSEHGKFIESHARGYGHWLWKPYIIQRVFQTLKEGDVLIYADAGCTINPNGKERFQEYLHMVETNPFGLIAFQLEHPEIKYTKRILLEYCETPIEDMKTGQCMATVFMLRKTPYTTSFVNDWYFICSRHGYIDDSRHPTKDEYKLFIDHRHDQSVFSLLVKRAMYNTTKSSPSETKPGPIVLPDETFFHPDWKRGIKFPIWATRIRQ